MKTFFGSSFLLSDFALRGVWSRHHSLHKVAHRCQKSSSGHAPAHSQAQLGASVPFLLPTNHWTPQFNCIETNQLGSPIKILFPGLKQTLSFFPPAPWDAMDGGSSQWWIKRMATSAYRESPRRRKDGAEWVSETEIGKPNQLLELHAHLYQSS